MSWESVDITGKDFFTGILLTLAYSVVALEYSSGFYQAAWIKQGVLSPTEASVVNSFGFALELFSIPFFQLAMIRFKLKPYATLSVCAALISIGFLGCSFSTSFYALLLFRGLAIAFAISLAIVSCYTGLYQFFRDDQLDIFSAIFLSGTGMGLLIVYVTIELFMQTRGWQFVMRCQLIFVVIIVITVLFLSPKGSQILGIKSNRTPSSSDSSRKPTVTKEEQKTLVDKMISAEKLIQSGNSIQHSCSRSCALKSQSQVTLKELLLYFMSNAQFMLCLISFGFGGCGFDSLMLHHPVRMELSGVTSGPSSLALNGCMQIIARVPVGIIATRGYVSAVRMSQVAKLSLIVSTLLCNYFQNATYQSFFYFFIGIGGSVINIADFLLIRESVCVNREFGAALFNLINGALNLPVMSLMGVMFEKTQSYQTSYFFVTALLIASYVLTLVYELVSRRNRRILQEESI